MRIRRDYLRSVWRQLARHRTRFSAPAPTRTSSIKSSPTCASPAPHRHRRMGALPQPAQLNTQTAAHKHCTGLLGFKFTHAGQTPTQYRRSTTLCVRLWPQNLAGLFSNEYRITVILPYRLQNSVDSSYPLIPLLRWVHTGINCPLETRGIRFRSKRPFPMAHLF